MIRLGTFPGAAGGVGQFNIAAAPPPPACDSGVGCQFPDQQPHGAGGTLASTSDLASGFTTSENIRVTQDGDITALCFWGIYFDFGLFADCGPGTGDDFTVTYYADDMGGTIPGSVLAGPFSVSVTKGLTGNVLDAGGTIIPEWQFEATHPPVSVTNGTCYWVEITNNAAGTCFWLWSTAPPGDNRAAQSDGISYAPTDFDLAVCVDVTITDDGCGVPDGPDNDSCEDAEAIAGTGNFFFDNTTASTDGPAHAACLEFGSDQVENDVWFCWTAACDGDTLIQTCGTTGVDTKIAVYDGCGCPATDANLIACNDDTCGLQSAVTFSATSGSQYLIRLGTFPGASGGVGEFNISCISLPDNDFCENAIPVAVPSVTPGDTTLATVDTDVPDCQVANTSPGLWYSVIGTGNTMTASVCNGTATWDSKISVYCGSCDDTTCVVGNDDFCGLQSQVSWCSQAGAEYLVLVQRAERFVEQQHAGPVDQRPGQRDALALAAGQLRRGAAAMVGQAHHRQRLLRGPAALCLGHAGDLEAIGDVVDHVHVGEQGIILEHRVDVSPIWRHPFGGFPENLDMPRCRLLEPGDQPQTACLARPRRPKQRKELTLPRCSGRRDQRRGPVRNATTRAETKRRCARHRSLMRHPLPVWSLP